ncbi:hypothetical protein UPYG_G00292080 [Umbra pygmaea]|uniref:Protein kinase domain-containing protein n=1 Tax=Umbra pygmaea TaxID=75934 RepID=A0ABD0W4Z0_UMBPY
MSSKIVNSNSAPGKPSIMSKLTDCTGAGLDLIQNRIEFLSSKMDRLINIQEKVLNRLDGMSQDIDGIERDVETLKVDKEEIHISAKALTLPPALAQTQGKVVVGEVKEMCQEMTSIMAALDQRSEKQSEKLDGMEKLVLSIQQVIRFIGENVKSSRVMELMFMDPAARKAYKLKDSKSDKLKDHRGKDEKEKSGLNTKGHKAQKKKKKLLDTADSISQRKQALLLEEVQKLNRENAERSSSGHEQLTPAGPLDLEAGSGCASDGSVSTQVLGNALNFILDDPKAPVAKDDSPNEEEEREAAEDGLKEEEKEEIEAVEEQEELRPITQQTEEDRVEESNEEMKEDTAGQSEVDDMSVKDLPPLPPSPDLPGEPDSLLHSCEDQERRGLSPCVEAADQGQMNEDNSSCKRRVTEEDLEEEDHKKSRVEGGEGERDGEEGERKEEEEIKQDDEETSWGIINADRANICQELRERLGKEMLCTAAEVTQSTGEQFLIDKCPPPPAPFKHRIVSAKPNQINNFYTINRTEVLGGGRFGQVHKCMENSSGLTLAAKIIKARTDKEKEVVKNEITVMNHLDHANLIQLYAAYESRNDIILVLEYVDGGELFDRIIDENYTLMELDTVVFIRQICEGLQHMHKMYILHLDLKPENILCVSRVTNKVKIIDFGLARIYKPREKLRVNFGTPEFLAPEVVNYDFVSFNTDMWSLGVITYMLLSGLCPFLGDDNNETMNNILACQWNFEEAEFRDISEEAKDFISKLLIVNKSWRIGATEALRHPWLSDPELHHRLHEKKNMCNRSRRSSCVHITDS